MYTSFIKIAGDFLAACLLLIILSPVLLVTIVILMVVNRGDVWFVQVRPGKDCKPFSIFKFRTMTNETDKQGQLLPDEKRLTLIGKIVRRTSIDEIPQLINVLKGEMSIVGPRPLLMEYIPLYNESQLKRHDVRPGITGWAQVNGRNALDWQEKFNMDLWYVNNISFALDIKILFLTVIKVFKSEGISSKTSATMERFNGNK